MIETAAKFLILPAIGFLGISKAVIEAATAGSLAFWLIGKVRQRRQPIPAGVPFSGHGVLFLLICLSAVLHPEAGIRGVLKWGQWLLFFVLCADLFHDGKLRDNAVRIFLGSMLLVSFNGFYQLWAGTDFLRGVPLDPGRIVRMKSSLGAANNLASFYLFAIPLAFAMWYRLGKWNLRAALSAGMLALFFLGLMLTFSRGAFFALILGLSVYLAARRQLRFFLCGAAVAGILLIPDTPIRQNFVETLHSRDITLGERAGMWQAGWEIARQHFWFGTGPNTYLRNAPVLELDFGPAKTYAHNSYLQLFAEVGIFGLIAFLLPFGWMLYHEFRPRNAKGARPPIGCLAPNRLPGTFWGEPLREALFVGLTAFLAQAFIDNNFFAMQPAMMFWIFWGMYLSFRVPADQ